MADLEYIPETDVGREKVEDNLQDLEKRIADAYKDAANDITTDLDAFLAKYEAKDKEKKEEVDQAEKFLKEKKISQGEYDKAKEDYEDWRKRQVFRSGAMQAKIDDLTQRMVNADKQAMAMVNNELPEVYATSYNYGGYRGETYANAAGFDYTQFTVINEDAVRTLMTEDPDLIPWKPEVDETKDVPWNRKHIQNAVQQGIIKGDGMDKIAKRLLPVVNMDKNAAIRTARTAVNGVENKGRMDATQRVKDAGIPMVEVWSATHDGRTRHSHILMDGETRGEDGLFSNGLEYPAEPNGNVDGSEIYNCRCRLNSYIEGIDHSQDDELYAKFMEEEYYDDWMEVKVDREEKEAAFQEKKGKAEGKREKIEQKWAENKERRLGNQAEKSSIPVAKAQPSISIPSEVQQSLDKFEKKYTMSNKENSMLISEDGTIIFQDSGKKDHTSFAPSFDFAEQLSPNTYSIHNHPAAELFSPKDISNYEMYGVHGLITTTDGYEYLLFNTNDPIWMLDDLEKVERGSLADDWRKAVDDIGDQLRKERRDYFDTISGEERTRQRELMAEWDERNTRSERYIKWFEENAQKRGFIFRRRRIL